MKKNFVMATKRFLVVLLSITVLLTSFNFFLSNVSAETVSQNVGEIINGDFENGTTGFTQDGTMSKFETVVDPENANNHILNVSGSTEYGKGAFWQDVAVEKNTDYVWSFRIKETSKTYQRHDIAVYPGGTINKENQLTLEISSPDAHGLFDLWEGWYVVKVKVTDTWATYDVKFNSGDNTTIKLWHNAYKDDRNGYIDNWKLTKLTLGEIINGDFENGTTGFTQDGKMSKFKTVVDPENASNHILNVSGGTDNYSGAFWQDVAVEENTDYVWTFRIKETGINLMHNIAVYPGGTSDKNNQLTLNISSPDAHVERSNTGMWDGYYVVKVTIADTWATYDVKFNSGDNTTIRLWHNAYKNNRNGYIDDWKLSKLSVGQIINGGFENGVTGFSQDGKMSKFETVVDPENASNHILNVSGGTAKETGAFWQDVVVEANTDYIWTFRMKETNSGDISRHDIAVYPGGTSNKTQQLTLDISSHDAHVNISLWEECYVLKVTVANTWATYNVKFNSGDNTTIRLWHNAYLNNRNGYIDDWQLGAVSPTLNNINIETVNISNYEKGLRVKASYLSVDNSINFNDEEVQIAERGIIAKSSTTFGVLAYTDKDREGFLSVSKSDDFDTCWDYSENIYTYSMLINDMKVNDTREVSARAYIKLTDGRLIYSEVATGSVSEIQIDGVQNMALVWGDEFDGTELDKSKWTLKDEMPSYESLEFRTDESAISVSSGAVKLSSGRIDDTHYYTHKTLSTADTMAFAHGYVEMRAKIPMGSPAFPSWWMLSSDLGDNTNSYKAEVDIFQSLGSENVLSSNLHKWYGDGTHDQLTNKSLKEFTNQAEAEKWHVFGLLWNETSMQIFIDGVKVRELDISEDTGLFNGGMGEFHQPMYLIFNNYLITNDYANADGHSWAKDFAASSEDEMPLDYYIDYVRLYQADNCSLITK